MDGEVFLLRVPSQRSNDDVLNNPSYVQNNVDMVCIIMLGFRCPLKLSLYWPFHTHERCVSGGTNAGRTGIP